MIVQSDSDDANSTRRRGNGQGTVERRGRRWYGRVTHPVDGTRPWIPLGEGLSRGRALEKLSAFIERGRETGKLAEMIDRLLERPGTKRSRQRKIVGRTVKSLGEAWTSGELFEEFGAVNGLRDDVASAQISGWSLAKHVYELRLRVNEAKSAVARPQDRKFLGYSFWYAKGGTVKRRVANKALVAMKDRVRDITKRTGGRSIPSVIAELRGYLVGWKNYFQLADTRKVFGELDEWIRRRLRAIHLKQWKRGTTIFRELVKRGMRPEGPTGARRIAGNGRRWWRTSGAAINIAFPISYFDGLGLPRLATTSTR